MTCDKSQSGFQAHVDGVKIQKGSIVSILRPSTIFAERAPMVSDTNFELSQAYEAQERATRLCHGELVPVRGEKMCALLKYITV